MWKFTQNLILIILLLPTVSIATTYYVAPGGNDQNPGSALAPFATLQRASNQAAAGDTIIVRAGTYAGAKFATSGTSASPILVKADPGAIITSPGPLNTNNDNLFIRNASYIIIDGFEVHSAPRSGIAIQGEPTAEVRGIVIRNNDCHNNGRWGIFTGYAEGIRILNNHTSYSGIEHGIYVSNSADNPVISGNLVHHNNASGIQINADPFLAGDGIISNARIDHNVIYENGTAGGAAINLASVINSEISNNLLYDNHASGIAGWDDAEGSNQFGTHHNKFLNNTIVQASNGRFAVVLLNGSTNNQLKNNILIHKGTRGSIEVDTSSEVGLDSDYNALVNVFSINGNFINFNSWKARNHDSNSFVSSTSALFVNAPASDYHLSATSPAIDRGITRTDIIDDLEFNARPQGSAWDIGAYEYLIACDSDATDPSVQITAPANNATVSGTINITAAASDNCDLANVEFFVDGVSVGVDGSSPYNAGWNSNTAANGLHSITATAMDNAGNTSSASISVNVSNGTGGFFDDFEDGSISNWTLNGGTWNVTSGVLNGTASKTGRAIAPFAGCSVCTIQTSMKSGTGSRAMVSLLGWYQSNNTYIELLLNHSRDRWQLKQLSGGSTVAQKTAVQALSPNIFYNVSLSYDGSLILVKVNGTQIMTMTPGSLPNGKVGFQVKATTGSFPEIQVQ